MVTLAFAQAFTSGGEQPTQLDGRRHGTLAFLHSIAVVSLRAVPHEKLYWIALAFLVIAYAIVWLVTSRVRTRLRRDSRERAPPQSARVRPFRFKMVSFVVSSLIATGGGIVYIL